MGEVKNKKFTFFIGIDVSKETLDWAVLYNGKLLFHKLDSNTKQGIVNFILELKTLKGFTLTKAIFCMEHTGIYCNNLLQVLKKYKANVAHENALKIKNSFGLVRNKSDKVDSIRIAQYAYVHKDSLRLSIGKRPEIISLANLFSLRNRLLGIQIALNVPLNEQRKFTLKTIHTESDRLCNDSLNALKSDLGKVDVSIDNLIANDERLARLMRIVTSVPNVGRITGIQVIISTNEFLDINCPRKFACYSGVAPFQHHSGKTLGRAKVSHIANKKVKALLHICAMGATRGKGELKDYYVRKTQDEGKPKMAVINALRNKIIYRIFACVNQDRLFNREHLSIKAI